MSTLRSRVRRFYLYQACSAFAIWIPYWALWMQAHVASYFEFTLADVAFWVGLLIFQLPVGVLADRLGRKWTIVLSESFRTAGILGYGFGINLLGYVAANIIWSIGGAFSIGTSAYLYETLMEARQEAEFPRYIGRNTFIQIGTNAAAALVGGVVVAVTGSYQITLILGGLINVSAIVVAASFVEPAVDRQTEPTALKQLGQGLRIVRRREGVALLIGLQVFLGVALYLMTAFRSPYLAAVGIAPGDIGVWVAGFLLVAAVVSAFTGAISDRLGEFGSLSLIALFAAGPFFGLWIAGRTAWAAILLQIPVYVVWSLEPPLISAYLNRRLEPGLRATVLSMGSFAYTLGLVIAEPLAGLAVTGENILILGLFLGLLTAVPCTYILVRWRATVAPWPAITPIPSRLVPGGARVSRFSRVFERLGRLWP
ncbi:MAG TPA: MFS transporter [Thermoplasmata archaeon]|nr:MFS transporter [Thermoplasmata archaeon]